MNWFLPIGLSIGTFIGLYLSTQSFLRSLTGALAAWAAGFILSLILRKQKGAGK
ncbi:hypothetical protein [Metabacillus indicus]|uniref:hypothetical protein n=1 Tax=Metabacillus indicus TaxID=246786 RepID=UPI001300C4F5|nr:hypothetical protein [Metabacillus indicus]